MSNRSSISHLKYFNKRTWVGIKHLVVLIKWKHTHSILYLQMEQPQICKQHDYIDGYLISRLSSISNYTDVTQDMPSFGNSSPFPFLFLRNFHLHLVLFYSFWRPKQTCFASVTSPTIRFQISQGLYLLFALAFMRQICKRALWGFCLSHLALCVFTPPFVSV